MAQPLKATQYRFIRKSFYSIIKICLVVLTFILLKVFCSKCTDGFERHKINSSLSFNSDWETKPLSFVEKENVLKILDQPFHYLAKGAQSYVFESEDHTTVIKFFRLYHLRVPYWMTFLNMPLPLQSYKIRKMIQKRQDLDKDFQSYKIAFKEMKDQTGLLYLHLNKTSYLNQTLTLYDKIGVAHQIDLDEMEFLVQKKAVLVYPAIDCFMKGKEIHSAKEAISSLIKLLQLRYQKEIFDKDPDLNTNFGFLGTTAVQIDVGRFQKKERVDGLLHNYYNQHDEILRITDNFRQWLDQNYPELSSCLLSAITDTIPKQAQ